MKKKHILLTVMFVMMCVMLGKFDAHAATNLKSYHYTNPYYEDVVTDTTSKNIRIRPNRAARNAEYTSNQQNLVDTLKEKLVARESTITLYYHCDEAITQEFFDDLSKSLFERAVQPTGIGKEGDYLKWHYSGWTVGASYSGNQKDGYNMQLTYNVSYLSTAQQEEQVDNKIYDVLDSLGLKDKTDYQKVKAIYDYICSNVTYDYKNLNDDTYTLKYTAYAALINKTSVCQGYASLFYRMALDAGVDARVISGNAGGAHAWDIVCIDGEYYNLDSTWDAGRTEYSYFLKNMDDFSDHIRDDEYSLFDFADSYPMSEMSYQDRFFYVDDIQYSVLDESSVSVWDGSAASGDFEIPAYVTHNGKTYMVVQIGYKAFYQNTKITSVVIPDTVTSIEDGKSVNWIYYGAFEKCTALKTVSFSKNLTYIGELAFSHDSALENVTLPEKLETIMDEAFGSCSSITELELPAATTYVGQCALSGTSLVEFTIPKTCSSFHVWALDSIPTLENVYVDSGQGEYCSVNGLLYSTDMSWLELYPAGKKDQLYRLPEQTTVIRSGVFPDDGYLETLVLNSSIDEDGLGTAILQGTNISTIEVPSDNLYLKSVDGVLFSKDEKTLLLYPPNKPDAAYFIPAGTINIGRSTDYTFESCKNLEELYIPASIENWNGIMWMSDKLKQVVFASESKLTSLPSFIFQECSSLESICLPASIQTFSDDFYGNEFLYCENLNVLYAASGAGIYDCHYFGCQTLSGCSNLTVYGEGDSNALSQLAETFYRPYQDVSQQCDKVLGITFKDTIRSIEPGTTESLNAVIYPKVKSGETLTYTSSDASIATVDANGNVTGVKEGRCYITATSQDGTYARCQIQVGYKHEHEYEVIVTEPTCTENGYTTYTCKGCGDSYVSDETKALGHDFEEWTVSKEATCTEAGERIRKCIRCDYTESEEIVATGHDYEAVVTAPTCTENGYTTHTCKVCGYGFTDNEIPATGHNYVNGICTSCGQQDPNRADHYALRYITVNGRAAWYYANDKGRVDTSYTGVADNEYGWWYVRNGEVDFSYTGLGNNAAGWWRIVNGQVDFSYTGVAANENGWWRIVNGQVDFSFTGLAQNEYGWWYISNGMLDFSYNGYVNWYGVNYRVQNGQVMF